MHPLCLRCGIRMPAGQPAGLCPACQGAASPGLRRTADLNVQLHCICGWKFFAPRSSPPFVNCPSCGAPVASSGARNNPPPPADPAPAPAQGRGPLLVIAASAGIVALAGILALVLILRPKPAPPPPAAAAPADRPEAEAPARPAPSAAPAARKSAPADYVDYSARIDRLVSQANMAGIAGAILLETGHPAEHAELEDRMRVFDREIRALDRLRTEQGERQALPPYFLAGDRLVSLSQRVRDPAKPVPFADELKEWLRGFRAGARETVSVVRGLHRPSFEASFPERTKEINLIAQRTGIMLGEGNPAAAAPPPPPPLPPAPPGPSPHAAALADMRTKVEKLLPYYRERIAAEEAERARQAVAQAPGAGPSTDLDAVRYRALSELHEAFTSEHAGFATRAADLEAKLPSLAGTSDVVHFKDGRRIEGTVEEQADGQIRVRSRIGAATFSADQILRIEKGKGSAQAFPARYQAARGKRAELDALLGWCRDNNLPVHRELVANALLHADPGHAAARADAGFVKLPSGEWARSTDARLREGKIEWHGRLYAPEQLRQELKSLGYVQLGNTWYEKVPAVFRIDNLYRDENLLARHLRGATVSAQVQTERDTAYDVRTKSWVPRTRQVTVARYLAGFPVIDVEFPGPLLECRVKARSQTPRIGDTVSVAVSFFENDPFPKTLYTLSAPGENVQSFDVSDKALGNRRLFVRGSTGGGGMFLPSDANDLAVLEVKYSWGRPLAKLSELLIGKLEPAPNPGAAPAAALPPIPLPQEAAASSDLADARARGIAAHVAGKTNLLEALEEVRKAMETQLYYREIPVPIKFQSAIDLIQNPLQPSLSTAPRDQVIAVASWWAGLPAEERAAFATFYGLWCARVRATGR